ncbi:hypothetical protein ANO11243_084290 [Dothideomycetidae sp. 11243]|nr:hypothetical protein ANO11243_084290 [fungal sp. No.11243]
MADRPESPEYRDTAFADVFGDSDGREVNGELSENLRLRSVHVTNGYRDGIAESKSSHVQDGFDEGYPLGAVLGYKAAWLLKVLDTICTALEHDHNRSDSAQHTGEWTFSDAQRELSMDNILSAQYFDQDGDLDRIGKSHPLIAKWTLLAEGRTKRTHRPELPETAVPLCHPR